MSSHPAARLSRFLVRCHPRRWRQRYGDELLDVLDQHHVGARTALDLAFSALDAHLDPACRWLNHPGDDLQQRRLAGTVAAYDGHLFATPDGQVDPTQRDMLRIVCSVGRTEAEQIEKIAEPVTP